MRSPTSARILVVGAGIAGLGTARALARAGFAAEVVERQRTWQEAGAGIYLLLTAPDEPKTVAATPLLGPGVSGVSLRGTF